MTSLLRFPGPFVVFLLCSVIISIIIIIRINIIIIIITGDQERPDIALVQQKVVPIIELTIGFETNMEGNSARKRDKYKSLKASLMPIYDGVNYVNVSMGACGFIEKDSKNLFDLLRCLKLPENEILFLTRRITNTCIRALYYIFCRRSKEWTSPKLLSF